MTRAMTLATFLSAFLAVGNGFVLVAPRVTPPESSRPKQAAQAPAEVGGPGTAGAFSLSGAEEAKAVLSAEDHATCSPDSCPHLHAIGAVEPKFDDDNDVAVPIVDGMTVMETEEEKDEKEEEEKEEEEKEVDSWVDIVPLGQEKNVMRLTVTVEQITSDTTGFKTEIKESGSKVVASAVHEWTPTDAGDGAESETTARRHGDAGSLYGVSVDALTEQFAKIADATQVRNGQLLSQNVFLAAIDVVCCEITSRAFIRPHDVEPNGGNGADEMTIGRCNNKVPRPSNKRRSGVLRAHDCDSAGFEAAVGSEKVDAHDDKAKGGSPEGEEPAARTAAQGSRDKLLAKLWRRIRRQGR